MRVRRAGEADRTMVGYLLAVAFADKFAAVLGPDLQRNAAVLAELPSLGTVYVADSQGQVVGTFTLVLEERTHAPLWPVLRRHLGFWQALRALVRLQLIGTSRPEPHTALVEAVAVLPEWRGRGVGRCMMTKALAEARRAGHRRVGLYVVEGNEPAVRLYTSLGFRVQHVHPARWARSPGDPRRVLYMTVDL
ncbi:MAG: hypothetical protein C4303_08240 [candidate division GAL15 bacterium]